MIGFTIPNIIGTIVLITVKPTPKTQGGLVVAFYAMQVFQAVSGKRHKWHFCRSPNQRH